MQPEAGTPDGIKEVKGTGSSLMLQEICESSCWTSTAADILSDGQSDKAR